VGPCIAGGEFGSETTFPGDYQQSYFFADYVYGWLRRVVLAADGVTVVGVQAFATGLGNPTEVVAGADGALYLPDITAGTVRRIGATGVNRPPVAKVTATPAQGPPPLGVELTSAGSGDPDGDAVTATWDFGDGAPGASGAVVTHTYAAAGVYTVRLTVTDGRGGSDTAAGTITVGTPPVVTITQPAAGTRFGGGETLGLAGSATDAEDGPLPASALRWEVRFHHDDHWHPYLAELAGSPQGFVTATSGETSANVWYRVYLRAMDGAGLTGETWVDVVPRTVTLTLATQPPGLAVTLDGQPAVAPVVVPGVVGVQRTLGVASPQGGYTFLGWSDGGVQVHTISTPATDTTYTAVFEAPPPTTSPPTTTTTTTTPPTTTTTSTTTSTSVATSSTVAPASTTSTTAVVASTTTTSAPIAPSTTTSTLPMAGCPPRDTIDGVVCLLDEARAELPATSAESDRVLRSVSRRLWVASGSIQRARKHCEAGRNGKARNAVRGTVRRVARALTVAEARGRRAAAPTQLTAADVSRLESLVQDLRNLAGRLACP
jgi:PKD repeat protein